MLLTLKCCDVELHSNFKTSPLSSLIRPLFLMMMKCIHIILLTQAIQIRCKLSGRRHTRVWLFDSLYSLLVICLTWTHRLLVLTFFSSIFYAEILEHSSWLKTSYLDHVIFVTSFTWSSRMSQLAISFFLVWLADFHWISH